jgi:hypothetical protein
MSPPIYTPDGSEVSEIVLPDGSTASEVIGPDGNVVFEAGADIPDSAIHQWKYDEGSGTEVSDSIGTLKGTLSTDTLWKSDSDLVGGYGLEFTGTENVDHNTTSDLDRDNDYSLAITINPNDASTDVECVFYSNPDGTDTTVLNVDNGTLIYEVYDGGRLDTRSWSGVDSTRTRIGVSWDSSTQTGEIWANGSQVDDGTTQTRFNSGAAGFKFAENDDANSQNFTGILDNPIIYDKVLSSNEWSKDYNAQPWS